MFRWLSFSIEDIAYIHFSALLYDIRYFSHVLNALKRGKEQILLFHRRRYKLPLAEYNCLRKNSTTSSCRGSCERETKQSKRQRMAPACVQLSSEHQQPFTRERVPVGLRWRAYTLPPVNSALKKEFCSWAVDVNFDNFGAEPKGSTGPLVIGQFLRRSHPHRTPCTWLTASVN